MKKIFISITMVVLVSLTSFTAKAGDVERTSRQGFFIGFDLGGGGVHIGSPAANTGAMLGGLKIGGGFNEKFLLMYEGASAATFRNDEAAGYASLLSGQFFLTDQFYVRPGLGFAVTTYKSGPSTTTTSKAGLGLGFATGYEMRLTKRFALSPEAKVDYARTNGHNNTAYGVSVDLRWYF